MAAIAGFVRGGLCLLFSFWPGRATGTGACGNWRIEGGQSALGWSVIHWLFVVAFAAWRQEIIEIPRVFGQKLGLGGKALGAHGSSGCRLIVIFAIARAGALVHSLVTEFCPMLPTQRVFIAGGRQRGGLILASRLSISLCCSAVALAGGWRRNLGGFMLGLPEARANRTQLRFAWSNRGHYPNCPKMLEKIRAFARISAGIFSRFLNLWLISGWLSQL